MLQTAAGDVRHQRVPMQPGPGPALEVPEPEIALDLPVCLLAHPAHLDRRGQSAQRRAERWVGLVELALAGGAPSAN